MLELITPLQPTPDPDQSKSKLRCAPPALVHLGNTPSGEGGFQACQTNGAAFAVLDCVTGPSGPVASGPA